MKFYLTQPPEPELYLAPEPELFIDLAKADLSVPSFEIDLVKAGGHRYVKRTGGPGNYKYWYKQPDGSLKAADHGTSQHKGARIDHVKRLLVSRMKGHHQMSNDDIASETGHEASKIQSMQSNLRTAQRKGVAGHDYAEHELREHIEETTQPEPRVAKPAASASPSAISTPSTGAPAPRRTRERVFGQPIAMPRANKEWSRKLREGHLGAQVKNEEGKVWTVTGVEVRPDGSSVYSVKDHTERTAFLDPAKTYTVERQGKPETPKEQAVRKKAIKDLGFRAGLWDSKVESFDPYNLYIGIDRYRRHDHGGGDDGDGWLEHDEIQADYDKGVARHKAKLDSINTILKENGFSPNAEFDLGEKGHFSIRVSLKKFVKPASWGADGDDLKRVHKDGLVQTIKKDSNGKFSAKHTRSATSYRGRTFDSLSEAKKWADKEWNA